MSYHFFVYLDYKNLNNDHNKIKLEFNDSNISSITVQQLKIKLSEQNLNLPKNYDLIFLARTLKDNNKLSDYGIKSGANLFLLPNNQNDDEMELDEETKPKFEKKELEKMIVAIRTALFNGKFRNMLSQLYDKEFRENLVACIPALKKNIIAFTILLDPELMMICSEKDNLTQFSKKLSVFVEAASHLACAFHEENASVPSQSNSLNNSNIIFGQNAYSLDAQSDEELDVPSANQQVRETQPIIQNNRITTDMLQAAINASVNSRQSNPTSVNSNQNTTNSQASSLNSTAASSSTNQTTTTTKDWSKELATMREFGFMNDSISKQALEATNGNIEQAVSLYLILNNQTND